MVIDRNLREDLAFKCQRRQDGLPANMAKQAIIEPASVPDAAAPKIKCDTRYDHQVNVLRIDPPVRFHPQFRTGFENTESSRGKVAEVTQLERL